MLNLDPSLPWDTLLNRILQSWRDSAPRISMRPRYYEPLVCDRCRTEKYINLAINSDPGIKEEWPHWMQHSLREELDDLRSTLLFGEFERPLGNETVGHYYRGSALIPYYSRSAEVEFAIEIVEDFAVLYNLWLSDRLANIHPWPQRVRRAVARHARSQAESN